MTIQRLLPVLVALALFAGAPAAHGDIADVLATPYPDPQQRITEAKGAAQFGGPQEQWVLAEALIGVHRFAESDRAFRAAASGALEGDTLDLRAMGQLADRLEQRMLLEQAIQVRERRVERALAGVPADGLLTRAERELAAGAMDDYKRIAELHRRLLRYDDYFAARERVLDIAPDDRRAGELATYLDELLWMERTDRALLVAQTHADLTSDVEVLRKALEVMIRERQQQESRRMLRLAVTSSMDYWDFRYLLVQYMEVFDPGVRWAADRDERLRALLVSRPPQAIDHLLLGSAYQVVGDTELEEQAYRSYLNTGGVTAPKLRTAGDLLYGMGKTAEAFLLYQRFLAEHPEHDLEPAVLLRVVDCLERTYDLQASFHGAFNAFGYLFLDERTPQVPVGIFSVLYNDVPLQTRMDGLEDALDRYYVDLLAVDLLWNMVERHPDAVETDRAFHDLLSYYQRYKDTDRQLEVCELYIQRYAHRPEANEFRFEQAAIHHQLGHYSSEEAAYRAAYDATLPPPGTPRPYEPVDPDELTRTQQHDRAFRSLLSYYDRDRVARFYDAVALYKAEIDVRGGDLALVDELVRLCDQQSAYDEIEQLYEEVIATYDTMAVYDKLARHYLRMRRDRDAEKVYQKARRRFAGEREPYVWLQGYYTDAKHYDQAEGVVRDAMETFPADQQWYFELASLSYTAGGSSARCAVYAEALQTFPHTWRFIDGLYHCRAEGEGRLTLLEQEYAVVPQARRWLLRDYGVDYLYVEHIREAESALARKPGDAVLHRYAGDLYNALSHFEEALEHYEIAARTMTDDAALLKRVGDLQRSFGRTTDAAATFGLLAEMQREGWLQGGGAPDAVQAVMITSPATPASQGAVASFWVTLGEVHAEAGDGPAALAAWRHVIERDQSDPETWLEVAAACWDYFLFDDAVAVFTEERLTLGDRNLHAKQLAAVYESKRDYRRAVGEYVTILGQGDPMVREDVRVRLVYLARHKDLDRSIRKTFERAIKAQPDHEGLYRNYADHCARLEDWPQVYAIYEDARRNVRDRRFLEWLGGEFERLEQLDRAEAAFADLSSTYASDASAWHTHEAFLQRRYRGAALVGARVRLLTQAHAALPTLGFHTALIPLLEKRGELAGVDDALRTRADAYDGAERFGALTDLALARVERGDLAAAADVLAEQRLLRLTLADHPGTWSGLDGLHAALLRAGDDELALRWLAFHRRDLALQYETVPTWVAVARVYHDAGRDETAGALLEMIQLSAPYRVDVARMRAEILLAVDDEAGTVQMVEDAVRLVDKIADVDPALRGWSPSSTPLQEVSPSRFGFHLVDQPPDVPGYDYNPFGEVLAAGDAGWLHRGDYGYGYGYGSGYDYGRGRGYGYGHGYEHGRGYDYEHGYAYDYGYGYGYDAGWDGGEDPAARGKRVRRGMRMELRRALVEIVVPRGMVYDGVTTYERMVNEDPLDQALLLEAWRYAAQNGYGDQFQAYYTDVQREAHADFRWYRVMASLACHRGDLAAEVQWLEKMLEVEPHRVDVHQELVTLYRRLGQEQPLVEHLDRVRFLTSDDGSYYRAMARVAFDAGRREEAYRTLGQAADLAPESASLHHSLIADLLARDEYEWAAAMGRRYLLATHDEEAEYRSERRAMFTALVDVYLHAGDPRQARVVWWELYDLYGDTPAASFARIYGAPGMRELLVADFQAREEQVVTDRHVRDRFREVFAAQHLYREDAALRTVVLDATLLRHARKLAETYDNPDVDRKLRPPSPVRRRLNRLSGDSYHSVFRDVDQRPTDVPAGQLRTDHALAVATVLAWEREKISGVTTDAEAIRRFGIASNQTDMRRYADAFDRGHRELAEFYQQRHLYRDAAAELRRIETLFGPLYNHVYLEQLDLLDSQIGAGIEQELAEQERERILEVALEECVAQWDGWIPGPQRSPSQLEASVYRQTSLHGYLSYTAGYGDEDYFWRGYDAALRRVGVSGTYAESEVNSSRHKEARELLSILQGQALQGSLELAAEVYRRSIETMPEQVSFQRGLLHVLANRGTREEVEAAVEELLAHTGRLWIYRWSIGYLAGQDDLPAALAMSDRGLGAFSSDVDLRLRRIQLLVELEELPRAAGEARFLVGDQSVGGYLQGEQIYANAVLAKAPDQTRTAMAHHTIHVLSAEERLRLFEVWAMGTGDEQALAYLVERHPRNAPAYERMSRAALQGGHHDLATWCLDQAARLYPEDPTRYHGLRGSIQWDAGQHDRARTTWRKLANEPNAEAVQEVFDLLWERDRHAEAVDLAVEEVVRRRGFDPGAGGQGVSIVSWAAQCIATEREHDLLARLYRGVAPVMNDPWTVANYAAHLRAAYRPDAAEAFLDDVMGQLEEAQQLSVLFSLATAARAEERYGREAQVLARISRAQPDELRWRTMRLRALVDAGGAGALDEALALLGDNRTPLGLQDASLATTVLLLLARAETPPDAAAADQLLAVLGDERYQRHADTTVAARVELELAAGRRSQALTLVEDVLARHPASSSLWSSSWDLLEAGGADTEACVLRGQRAEQLLAYLPADSTGLLTRARAEACGGDVETAIATAALAQDGNPGRSDVVLAHARTLLEIGRPHEALEVAAQVVEHDALSRDATLLVAEAALAAGDRQRSAAALLSLIEEGLDDALDPDPRLRAVAWISDGEYPDRAELMVAPLVALGHRRAADPRPDQLAASLLRQLDRPAAGEASLRRARQRAPNDPDTVVFLVDLLLAPTEPAAETVDEARELVEELYHLEPGRCDAGRLHFRVEYAAAAPALWQMAQGVPGMNCAAILDLERAEAVLVAEELYESAIAARKRLLEIDPERADYHRQRIQELIDRFEAAAGEGVER